MHRLLALLLCLLLPMHALAGEKVKVVASFSIIGDIVKQVGGERVDLSVLVGPNQSVTTYQPTPEAIKAMQDADLVIVNGISLEGWMGRMVVSSGFSGTLVVASRDITTLSVNDKLDLDPHAWLSIANVKVYATNIANALQEVDRRNSMKYKENTARYIAQLTELENWVQAQIDSVPDEQRVAVTPHGAFQYYGRYYGVRFLSPSPMGSEAMPSAADMARTVDIMRSQQIRAIFMENTSDNAIAKQLMQDTGTTSSGMLYTDALSAPGGVASTYIELMRHNTLNLISGMRMNGSPGITATNTLQIPADSTVISIP